MTRKKSRENFIQRLLSLISESDFIKYENILSEPNFFKIVGRAHYERWHSSFLGWLLDAKGSHLLSEYPINRFLMLLLDENCLEAHGHSNFPLLNLLTTGTISNVEVAPNEYIHQEKNVFGVGRFDIFITATYNDEQGDQAQLNIIVELKIDSKPDQNQSKKYADWLFETHPEDLNLLIYLTPKLLKTSNETIGDKRWYCLDYQLLNDSFLLPLIDHPNLNEKVKPFIIQYIKNLKIRYKGIKMAITNEEKRMALALYEKYSDVFDAIYDALVEVGAVDFTTSNLSEPIGRVTGRIAVRIDGKVFSNQTVRDLFEDILKFLVDKDFLLRLPLPWGTSNQRYVITNENPPKHPSGREFFYPVRYKGYTLESHYARERGLKVLNDLCAKLEIDFEPIETQ